MRELRRRLPWIAFLAAAITGGACATEILLEQSELRHDTSPEVSGADAAELANANSDFALELYQALRNDSRNDGKSLFFSPYSISTALVMLYAGARGHTAEEMKEALHFTLPEEGLHAAFNWLALQLAGRGQVTPTESQPFRLRLANSLWGHRATPFRPEFLDLLKVHYDAGIRLVDFERDPEGSRHAINEWVSNATEEKIKDLLPQGAVDVLTRLVLANAIYFKADWKSPFPAHQTRPDSFLTLAGPSITVDMMAQEESFRYDEGPDHQAVELPYVGDEVSMLVILPREGRFSAFEGVLSGPALEALIEDLRPTRIHLSLPRFRYAPEESFRLKETLHSLGMREAFDPDRADFTGMADVRPPLYVEDAFHRGFIEVDEKGTEAAAATGIVGGVTSAPPPPSAIMKVDRPFFFAIRDMGTQSLLFLGRIADPRG